MIDLYHIDEAGFAPTLPLCYRWSLKGKRLCVPYEAPQGRRVNVIGAYCSHGVEAGRFVYESCVSLPKSKAKKRRTPLEQQAAAHDVPVEQVGTLDGERFVQFLWKVAGRPAVYPEGWQRERPLVIVVDNYSVHKGERVQQEIAALQAAGITLFYLPSYSPELSRIEPIWHDVKHHEMTRRSYHVLGALLRAVEETLDRKANDLLAAHRETAHLLRAAA